MQQKAFKSVKIASKENGEGRDNHMTSPTLPFGDESSPPIQNLKMKPWHVPVKFWNI